MYARVCAQESSKSSHKLSEQKTERKFIDVPDQNGPHTPGINNLFRDTAIWQVEVPQTNTIRWHIASSSFSEHI